MSGYVDARSTELNWGDMVRRKNRPLIIGMVEAVNAGVVHVRWGKGAPARAERIDNLLLRVQGS